MSRIFEGNVSVFMNTKGEIALKRDAEGSWNAENATALAKKMVELSKKHKCGIHKWSYFVAEGGKDVLLMADRFGNPRITILPPQSDKPAKAKMTKLA